MFSGSRAEFRNRPGFLLYKFCINYKHAHTDENTQVHKQKKQKKKLVMAHLCFRLSGVQLKIRASICPKVSSEQAHNDR